MKTLLVIHEIEDNLDDLKKRISLAQHAGAHLNIVVLGAIRVVPMTAESRR